jgi:hypothetical protein
VPVLVRRDRVSERATDVNADDISIVVGAAHAAYQRGDLLSRCELPARALLYYTGRLDAGHPRERHALGLAQPHVQLGAIQAERPDLYQHPSAGRPRYREGRV